MSPSLAALTHEDPEQPPWQSRSCVSGSITPYGEEEVTLLEEEPSPPSGANWVTA
ncbi:hypothetical protein KBY93_14430 [Synechococcus sp. J7-Johnson]|uniref:hypothetical protein n=1 Tax=Synechococcus sp. J7-Johnson TaxID=2823737 RepID=UPI0020CC0508|nr:hypothetical protein [Synechococcus sp. J7-Johnson]MCP9841819.1 hypothetical protein [Synechococcus sp. J7-Johnson]